MKATASNIEEGREMNWTITEVNGKLSCVIEEKPVKQKRQIRVCKYLPDDLPEGKYSCILDVGRARPDHIQTHKTTLIILLDTRRKRSVKKEH